MNIFNKITLHSMKNSRTRTMVTVIGVILSAAMITAVATFAVSLQRYIVNGAIQKYGDWQVEFLDVPAAFVQARSHDPGVAHTAAWENIGYAVLQGGKNPNKPYLFIAGFSKEAFATLPIHLVAGRLPQTSGEILVPAHVAANGGVSLAVGDTLSLAVGSRRAGNKSLGQQDPYIAGEASGRNRETFSPQGERTYTIVGICDRPGFEESSAPGYTLITTAAVNTAGNFSLFVTLNDPLQVHAYANNAAGNHACAFNDNVLRFLGVTRDRAFNTLLYAMGGILVVLIMVGSVFLIYNSFSISLNERTQQFGILSSVGATATQLRDSVLFEGLCIGAVGIPIGVMVGIASIKLVIVVVAENFAGILYNTVPLTLTVSVPAIIVAAVVSMVTILISAYIPARKAANTPVMESIRQTNEVKIDSADVKTSKLAERIYGLEGTLALKNFKRNKKRYRSIVLSLVLSIVLFVSASSFSVHLKQAMERSVVDADYDICFTTPDMDDQAMFRLYDKLKTAGGVYASSYQAVLAYSCAVKAGDFSDRYRTSAGYSAPDETVHLPMDVQFIEDSEYLQFINGLGLPPAEYTGRNAKMITVAKAKPVANTQGDKGKLTDMFASRSLQAVVAPAIPGQPKPEQGRQVSLTLIDTIPLDTLPRNPSEVKPYVFMVIAPYQLKVKFDLPAVQATRGLTFRSRNPAQSVADMETIIQGEGITAKYTLYNVHKSLEQNRNLIFVVDVFAYVFVIMISLIATANVFNTISTNIKLRRRELAMLRSVGMSDRDFKKMMNFECVFYGLRTLLFGLPIAGILSWLIYQGLVAGGADIRFTFPWGSIGLSILGVFLVVFLTMLYAISKLKRENIIDALRDDMT